MIPLSQLGMINGTDNFNIVLSAANITPDGDHVRINWKDLWVDISMTDCDELIDDFWEPSGFDRRTRPFLQHYSCRADFEQSP